jgi:hypothetical protein
MSVIAYDGKTIAADRMATYNEIQLKAEKLIQIEPHIIVGFVGEHGQGQSLINWFTSGADPKDFPVPAEGASAALVVFTKQLDGTTNPKGTPICMFYPGGNPVPLEVTDAPMAWGSGGHIALGAMLAGKTAAKAVEIASTVADGCGFGVTAFKLK